jgi:hypothetical protein
MSDQSTLEVSEAGYTAVLDQMDIPRPRLSAYSKPVDLSIWPRDGVLYGGSVRKVRDQDAGLPIESRPGAKTIPFLGSRQIDVKKHRSGLFIVGIDFVPKELDNLLALKGLTLHDDGSLVDRNNEPAVGFVTSEMYRAQLHSPKVSQRGAILDAAPFPFTCFSFTAAAFYHQTGFGGNHRWYDASTLAVAYGPDGGGGCSRESPHTRIDYLQAIAAVNWPGNFQQQFGTDQLTAYDIWDVGYGWPAHGVPTTTHSAIWADGTFSMSRTANLSW